MVGDIYLAKIYFTDLSEYKIRPVLVIRKLGIEQPLELDSRVKPENDGVVEFENDLKSQLLGI